MIEVSFLLLALGIVLVSLGLWVRNRDLGDDERRSGIRSATDR